MTMVHSKAEELVTIVVDKVVSSVEALENSEHKCDFSHLLAFQTGRYNDLAITA